MTSQQSFLQRACRELGLTIIVPFQLTVRGGIEISAEALIPPLGAPKGMIIVYHYDALRGFESELPSLGYGYSVLVEPLPSEDFDLEPYVEMFSEWGWGNLNERKPNWMK